MSWSDEDLRTAFLASLGGGPKAASSADCPSAETIWDAFTLALPEDQRYRVIAHSGACPVCAQAWQTAKLIAEERPAETTGRTADGAPSRWQRWLRPSVLAPAMAGAAALLVAVVWLGPRDLGPVAPPTDSGVMRGQRIAPQLLTTDGAALGAGDSLAWRSVTGATHHKVVMYSQGGDRRLELPVAAADTMSLGEEVIEAFGPGQSVFWYVVAIDGAEPGAESEVRRFTLTALP